MSWSEGGWVLIELARAVTGERAGGEVYVDKLGAWERSMDVLRTRAVGYMSGILIVGRGGGGVEGKLQ